jgi:fatty acid desaturase
MPYHAEHHAYPTVPFHALPRLLAQVWGKIGNPEPGYLSATLTVNHYLFGGTRADGLGAFVEASIAPRLAARG